MRTTPLRNASSDSRLPCPRGAFARPDLPALAPSSVPGHDCLYNSGHGRLEVASAAEDVTRTNYTIDKSNQNVDLETPKNRNGSHSRRCHVPGTVIFEDVFYLVSTRQAPGGALPLILDSSPAALSR